MTAGPQRRAVLALLAAALAAPASAARAGVTRIGLTDAFMLLDSYLALKPAERDRFMLAYRALRNGKPTAAIQARIVRRDHSSTPVAVDADGWVTTLPTLDELKRRETFEVDGAPFDFALELRATMAPAAQLPATELAATLAQVNAAIVSMAGGDSSAVGRLTCVYFADAGSGRALLEGGAERPLPVFDFKLIGPTPYFEPRSAPHATTVALAKAPSRILLAGPPHR